MDVDDGGCLKVCPNKIEGENFSDTLDICLKRIFIYMKTTCHSPDGILLLVSFKLTKKEFMFQLGA